MYISFFDDNPPGETKMANQELKENKVTSPNDISEEKLVEEELDEFMEVAKELLAATDDIKIKKLLSNPSAIALSTTKHDAGEGIERVKKTPRQLFTLYLTNQFVARAINVRADTLVARGYNIVGGDEAGRKACEELIKISGGPRLFWQLSVNCDIAGDGFLEKVYNVKGTRILKLKHVHPLTLKYKTDLETDRILVDKDGNPKSYVQYHLDKSGTEVTNDIPIDRIAHLKFNALGDEFTGMSTIQPGYDTIVRLMNMEYSAAEAAVKAANPLIVVHSNTKSVKIIAQWATILGNITGKDQIFLPLDMDITLEAPGPQNFSDYAAYFLDAVVATFGVPKGVILGQSGGSGSSRGEGVVLTRHFYSLIRSNQQAVENTIDLVFQEYAELAGFKAPQIMFEDIAEDARLLAESAIELFAAGLIDREEAREMIGIQTPPSGKKRTESIGDDVKKSNMEAWHNNPGQKPGSQAGEKKDMKRSPTSTFREGKKRDQIK